MAGVSCNGCGNALHECECKERCEQAIRNVFGGAKERDLGRFMTGCRNVMRFEEIHGVSWVGVIFETVIPAMAKERREAELEVGRREREIQRNHGRRPL